MDEGRVFYRDLTGPWRPNGTRRGTECNGFRLVAIRAALDGGTGDPSGRSNPPAPAVDSRNNPRDH